MSEKVPVKTKLSARSYTLQAHDNHGKPIIINLSNEVTGKIHYVGNKEAYIETNTLIQALSELKFSEMKGNKSIEGDVEDGNQNKE